MSDHNLIYGDMYNTDRYVRKRVETCKSLLLPYVKEGAKILDIGCYTGDLLKILPADLSFDYYGVDNDETALRMAKKQGAKVIMLDLESEQIPLNQKFDIVLATEVLEHLKDPEKLILQVKHLLKEDGVVLISLPNECTLYHRIRVLFGKGIDGTGFAPHYHLHFPTVRQNDEFIARHFRILEKRYWIHTDVGGKLARLLSKIPDRIWFGFANLWPSLFARGIIYVCTLEMS